MLFDRDQLLQQTDLLQRELQQARQQLTKRSDDCKMMQTTLNMMQQELEHQSQEANHLGGVLERQGLCIQDMHKFVDRAQGRTTNEFEYLSNQLVALDW